VPQIRIWIERVLGLDGVRKGKELLASGKSMVNLFLRDSVPCTPIAEGKFLKKVPVHGAGTAVSCKDGKYV
jgi:hypothetical protein